MFAISYGNYSNLKRGKDLWNRVYIYYTRQKKKVGQLKNANITN